MALRLYLSPRSTVGRIHNILRDIVPRLAFDEIRNDARLLGVCLVEADAAVHATLAADPRVVPLSGLVPDEAAVNADLDIPLSASPSGPDIQRALDAQSIVFPPGSTLRDVARRLCRLFVKEEQVLYAKKDPGAIDPDRLPPIPLRGLRF